jgi:hypothetical protein
MPRAYTLRGTPLHEVSLRDIGSAQRAQLVHMNALHILFGVELF